MQFDEEAHRYTVGDRELVSVTTALAEAGIVDAKWFTEYTAQRGTAVHEVCQYYDEGDLDEDSIDPVVLPYFEAWKFFVEVANVEFLAIEQRVADLEYGYAGTFDRLAYLNGRLAVLDIKTGAPPKWGGLQLAGYERMVTEPAARIVVQLMNDGKFKLHRYEQPTDKDVFLSAVQVANWKRRSNR